MASCCCGSEIPDGQGSCSMCYGDMSYGSDGYYEEWARQQDNAEESRHFAQQTNGGSEASTQIAADTMDLPY